MCACMHVHAGECVHAGVHVCVGVRVRVRVCVCVCVCVHETRNWLIKNTSELVL